MKPACMSSDEYAAWTEANSRLTMPSPTPCVDCLPAFASAMRAEWRCDGEPGRQIQLTGDYATDHRRRQWRAYAARRVALQAAE